MKILLLLFVALLWGPALQAQALPDAQVPPLAFVALQRLYPQAQNVKWRKARNWYQASYTQHQSYRLVRFSASGDVEATGTDTAIDTLPLPIRRTLTVYYPSRIICQANEVTNTRTGGHTYELATCESRINTTIILTANGLKVPRARQY